MPGDATPQPPLEGIVTDGFTNWVKCGHAQCGLKVVRLGKVQCWCDNIEGELTHEARDAHLAEAFQEWRAARIAEAQAKVMADNAELFKRLADGDGEGK